MSGFRIVMLCLSAALVCMSLRTSHPQIASAVVLAAVIVALTFSLDDIGSFSKTLSMLDEIANQGSIAHPYMLKLCGLTIVAEFASDICKDAGEAALAHRIEAGVKIGILASALPIASEILEKIVELT